MGQGVKIDIAGLRNRVHQVDMGYGRSVSRTSCVPPIQDGRDPDRSHIVKEEVDICEGERKQLAPLNE